MPSHSIISLVSHSIKIVTTKMLFSLILMINFETILLWISIHLMTLCLQCSEMFQYTSFTSDPVRFFSLKTSFFKWQPDYDSAAYAYEKAGKSVKLYVLSIPYWEASFYHTPTIIQLANFKHLSTLISVSTRVLKYFK